MHLFCEKLNKTEDHFLLMSVNIIGIHFQNSKVTDVVVGLCKCILEQMINSNTYQAF